MDEASGWSGRFWMHMGITQLEDGKQISNISEEECKVFELLKEVKAISAKIPGSSASKLSSQNKI
jgi:hypothetical protein